MTTPIVTSPLPHAFEHGGDIARPGQRRALGWALGVNIALLIAELVGGLVFGSLALLAEAAHLVSDVAGLGIALLALVLTARPISTKHSFGFARAEVMAAQVSALLLLGAGVWILFEGVSRLSEPTTVNGGGLAAVATLGLVVNGGSAIILHRAQGESLNMRASFVHLATDAAGSLAAVVAGLAILGWGWMRADSVASIATAVLVLWTGWGLLRDSTHVLMEGTPRNVDLDGVVEAIASIPSVTEVHHVHLWNLASDVTTLSAHVALSGQPTLREAQRTAEAIKEALLDGFDLSHVTLELEEAADGEADEALRNDHQQQAEKLEQS